MAYNTKSLIVDAINRIVAQYFNPITDKYEAVEGANGATNVQITGSNVKLLDAVSAIGVGTLKPPVGSFKTYIFEVWGTATSFTLHIEAVGPSGTARTINKVWDELNNVYLSGSDVTLAGFYSVSVPNFTNIQANVTAVAGGNVNVAGGLMQ